MQPLRRDLCCRLPRERFIATEAERGNGCSGGGNRLAGGRGSRDRSASAQPLFVSVSVSGTLAEASGER